MQFRRFGRVNDGAVLTEPRSEAPSEVRSEVPSEHAAGGPLKRWFGGGEEHHIGELRRLLTTFGYLVANQGAVALIGLLYWAVVTHLFGATEVGLSAAAASTALLLAAVGALGVPLLLLAEIESLDVGERRVFFTTGTAIVSFVVMLMAIGTIALSPWLGPSLRMIGSDPVAATLFVIGSVATVAGLSLDGAAVGLHRGVAQLWRGVLSSVWKLACVGILVLLSTRTANGLIFAWATTLLLAFFACAPMLRLEHSRAGEGTLTHRGDLVRRFRKLSLQHHVLNLSISSVSYIIPLMATLLISPQQVAYFSAAFLLGSALMVVPYLLALSLFAERSGDPALLHRNVRRTLPLGLALIGVIVLAVEIGAPYALRLFGPAYAAHGTTALRLLILVGPAYVIKDHYVSIRRAQHRMAHAAAVMSIGTAVEVGGAALFGAIWGLNGICLGWVIAASCEALFLLSPVLHVVHRPPAMPREPALESTVGNVAD